MAAASELLLVGAVGAVGVLHTIVPDHWVPITLIARQQGWSKGETARVALKAGVGHVLSTLAIGIVIWIGGVAVATRFGHWVDSIASAALIGFGAWIASSAWRAQRHGDHGHSHAHGHTHGHGHGHSHDFSHLRPASAIHAPELQVISTEQFTEHPHPEKAKNTTALLLILGSSPMVEGIPAFFAASRYGVGLIIVMSVVFALATIATYVLLCVYSAAGLQRVSLGPVERYGEALSGSFIVLVGFAFWFWPVL